MLFLFEDVSVLHEVPFINKLLVVRQTLLLQQLNGIPLVEWNHEEGLSFHQMKVKFELNLSQQRTSPLES